MPTKTYKHNDVEYALWWEKRAFQLEWFFYTNDNGRRIVSPLYKAHQDKGVEAIEASWRAYTENKSLPEYISSSAVNIAPPPDEQLDDEHNQQLEALETLPKILYYETDNTTNNTESTKDIPLAD